jgi:hypothetical protein
LATGTADHPTSAGSNPAAPPDAAWSDADDVVLFDTEKVRRAARLARRSCRRHPIAAIAGVAIVLGAGSMSWLAAPLAYQSTAVISARSDVVSSAIANPGRAVPQGSDQPLANAQDTILSEANIDRIIEDANLIERQQAHAGETALGEFRRNTLETVGLASPMPVEQDELRRQLRQALTVQIDGGSNGPNRLTISVLWDDPEDARAIVAAAQENFLEDRHAADLGPIEAALDILERYKADADAEVARLRDELDFPSTETRDLPDGSPLRAALQTQADLDDSLNGARIEVDAAEAAFQYRYSVVQTPEAPLGPVSSMLKRLVMTVALAAAAAVGLATARHTLRKRAVAVTGEPQPAEGADASAVTAPPSATTVATPAPVTLVSVAPAARERRPEAPQLGGLGTLRSPVERAGPHHPRGADGVDAPRRAAMTSMFESPAAPRVAMSADVTSGLTTPAAPPVPFRPTWSAAQVSGPAGNR